MSGWMATLWGIKSIGRASCLSREENTGKSPSGDVNAGHVEGFDASLISLCNAPAEWGISV